MQTPAPATPRRTRRTRPIAISPVAVTLPYPSMPKTDDDDFWLVAWARATAKVEALYEFHRQMRPQVNASHPAVSSALWAADLMLRLEAADALRYVQQEGNLLYAWTGSTRLHGLPQ